MIGGDFNGHVGAKSNGFDKVHGNHGFGVRNDDGTRLLDFCLAANLAIVNTFFQKSITKLITYKSGSTVSQVDYILLRDAARKSVLDAKVIGSEECITQHKLLVSVLSLNTIRSKPRPLPPRRRTWKLKEPELQSQFANCVLTAVAATPEPVSVENAWAVIKNSLLGACDEVCGWTKGGMPRHRETWWWSDVVDCAIKAKRNAWKTWQQGGPKEAYLVAKRNARKVVYQAKKKAEEEKFSDLKDNDKKNLIFKMARRMKDANCDVVGEKCIKDCNGALAFDEASKLRVWRDHYEKLLNVEFPWDDNTLDVAPPIAGPPPLITAQSVASALKQMKTGKAPGPSGITAEMLRLGGMEAHLAELFNKIIADGVIPDDWNLSYLINLYKGKGDALLCGNYRGLKLLDQVFKVFERVLERSLRSLVDIDCMQFGFVPGRGTTDAIFILRQLHEKFLTKKKPVYFVFVDLEKAFDRVPRKVLWWSMRRLGVPEWLVCTVQALYANAKSKVRVNGNFSHELDVKVGVHQGAVLSPLLFTIVMEALSRDVRTGCPWELLYADDLVLAAESIGELKTKFVAWKSSLEAKGLRVNMGKTKVLVSSSTPAVRIPPNVKYPCGVCSKGVGSNSIFCVMCRKWVHKVCSGIKGRLSDATDFSCGRCRDLIPATPTVEDPTTLSLGDESLEVVNSFCYLGDMMGKSGGCYDAVTARMQSAWKNFRELLPILTNRAISLSRRGHVFGACIRRVLLYGCETWPTTAADVYRLNRCDNSMVRWICGVKPAQRIALIDLRSRLGIQPIDSVLRVDRLRWFGHTERMDDDCWVKKIRNFEIPGSCSRGRPQQRWSDVIRSDLRMTKLKPSDALDREKWRRDIRGRDNDSVKPINRWNQRR